MTEAFAWLATAMAIGGAVGAAGGGLLVDRAGPTAGFALAGGAGALAMLTTLLRSRTITSPRHSPESAAADTDRQLDRQASAPWQASDVAQPAFAVNSAVQDGTARLHDLARVDEPCLTTPERALRPPLAAARVNSGSLAETPRSVTEQQSRRGRAFGAQQGPVEPSTRYPPVPTTKAGLGQPSLVGPSVAPARLLESRQSGAMQGSGSGLGARWTSEPAVTRRLTTV
jgi:hypothetical protein